MGLTIGETIRVTSHVNMKKLVVVTFLKNKTKLIQSHRLKKSLYNIYIINNYHYIHMYDTNIT